MDACAASLKLSFECTGAVSSSYRESTLLNYTYDETEDLLLNEVLDESDTPQDWIGKETDLYV